MPSDASSSVRRRDRRDLEMPSTRSAAEKPPCSTTCEKYIRSFRLCESIFIYRSSNRTIHCVAAAGAPKNGPYNSPMFQKQRYSRIFEVTLMSTTRTIERTYPAVRTTEGGGFVVHRPFPTRMLMDFDPFLLLDEMGPIDYAPGEAKGAPDHPHRGFETVTYVLEGEMEHEDSAGHRGKLGPGDVQWMTAGAGIIHSEMPSQRIRDQGGRVHGFQVWVNLPKEQKMARPRYQEYGSGELPVAKSADGKATVRVIAGEALGARAVIETRTPIVLQDWTVQPGADVRIAVPAGLQAFVYVFEGSARVASREIDEGQMP